MNILKKIQNKPKLHKSLCLAGIVAAVTAASTMPALAQDFAPITKMLTTITTALKGPAGKAIGTIAVCAVGISAFTGRMNWMFAISVLLGLVLLFGAATIIGNMG
jgi:type IV secretion system protein VirB2